MSYAVYTDDLVWTTANGSGTIKLSTARHCVRVVRSMLATAWLTMANAFEANNRQVTNVVWRQADRVAALEEELFQWHAVMYFNGVCERGDDTVDWNRTSTPYRPWAFRPLAMPLITAPRHWSLDEARAQQKADRDFARMLKAWKANVGNVLVCE